MGDLPAPVRAGGGRISPQVRRTCKSVAPERALSCFPLEEAPSRRENENDASGFGHGPSVARPGLLLAARLARHPPTTRAPTRLLPHPNHHPPTCAGDAPRPCH